MNNLLTRIVNCKSEEEVKAVVDEALAKCVEGSNKVEELGSRFKSTVFEGFIHPDTKMRCSAFWLELYNMNTTDFLYEYATFIWKLPSLQSNNQLIDGIVAFLNWYFGITVPGKDQRQDFLEKRAWQGAENYEEYMENMNKNSIGNFKGQRIAMCTERGAVAQNILSLFGFDSFYCMGVIQSNDSFEDHAFNIIKNGNQFVLVDFSHAVPYKNKNGEIIYRPFYGVIPADKVEDFMHNKESVSFEDYEYQDQKRINLGERKYVVGVLKEELKAGMGMGS